MTLVLALLLEWLIGDPHSRFHPVALFGRWASWCESFLYGDRRSYGLMGWFCVVTVPFFLLWLSHTFLGWPFDVLLIWVSMGWKSLFEHVRAVLDASSDTEARDAVAKIVSRDTAKMSGKDARRAALESLAENASDAVVAPLFWFLLLGPLGAVSYRMINTLDAMWGYQNKRYQHFGWCAAKVDDVANYLPARISAWLILGAGESVAWSVIKQQAQTHVSPNAGWPEVALAYAADIKLGGPVKREGVIEVRPFYGADVAREVNVDAAQDGLRIVMHALYMAAVLTWLIHVVI